MKSAKVESTYLSRIGLESFYYGFPLLQISPALLFDIRLRCLLWHVPHSYTWSVFVEDITTKIGAKTSLQVVAVSELKFQHVLQINSI